MTDLAAIGTLLYGPRWQSQLARALGVSGRQVRRWVAGGDVPSKYLPKIKDLVNERIGLLKGLLGF